MTAYRLADVPGLVASLGRRITRRRPRLAVVDCIAGLRAIAELTVVAPDEPGKGLSILRNVNPDCRTSVDIDRKGVMLADTDEELDKVYRIIRDGRRCLTFTFDGNVLGEEQFEL